MSPSIPEETDGGREEEGDDEGLEGKVVISPPSPEGKEKSEGRELPTPPPE